MLDLDDHQEARRDLDLYEAQKGRRLKDSHLHDV